MKAPSLFAALLLLSLAALHAQSNPGERPTPADVSKSKPAPFSNPDADGNLLIGPGKLGAVVGFMQQNLVPHWPGHEGDLPNILLTKEAADCELPGIVNLHRVTPLQAVALAAAAADCNLEPIRGPVGVADDAPAIIGYRITRNKTPQPGSGNVSVANDSGAAASDPPVKSPEDAGRQITRVYAVGSVLHGRSPDEVKRSESGTFSTDDEKALLELVTDAVEKGEPNTPGPQFSIHQKSGALIVKATAAQQETVEQAIKALKENKEESKELEAQQEIVKQAIKALKEDKEPEAGPVPVAKP